MHDAFFFFFTVMFLCMANFCLTLQEDKLKRPLSDMESWKLARERSRRKEGESQYYGKTEEHLGVLHSSLSGVASGCSCC